MRRAAIGIVLAGLALALAPAAAGAHGCGLVRSHHGVLAVDVFKGHARCALAKRVIRIYFSDGGERHGNGSTTTSYAVIGRWRCAGGTGGGGCIRGGADYTTAPDQISGRFCGVVGSPRACRGRSSARTARLAAGRAMPPGWSREEGERRGSTACRKDRAHALSYVLGGDAG